MCSWAWSEKNDSVACRAMGYIVMTYIVMGYIVMAYIVMAYIVMVRKERFRAPTRSRARRTAAYMVMAI